MLFPPLGLKCSTLRTTKYKLYTSKYTSKKTSARPFFYRRNILKIDREEGNSSSSSGGVHAHTCSCLMIGCNPTDKSSPSRTRGNPSKYNISSTIGSSNLSVRYRVQRGRASPCRSDRAQFSPHGHVEGLCRRYHPHDCGNACHLHGQ